MKKIISEESQKHKMRTFSEYIGQASLSESRQKYIFGGTDDRNTKMHANIEDLTKGDTIYEYRFENILKPNYTLEEHVWEIFEIEKVDTFHTCFHGERIENGEYRYFTLYVNNEDMDEPITMYESKDRTSRIWHEYHVAITTYEADVERIRQTLIETFLKH